MAGQHGQRRYYQVLLQPNRAKLVEEIAAEKGHPCHGVNSADDLRLAGAGAAGVPVQASAG